MEFEPGIKLKIIHHISPSTSGLDISNLISLSSDELAALEEASMKQEETIYKQMCDMENQWAQQAKETVRIRHAKDYLRTPATLHTSNCWVKDGDWHRISNMVYKMSWRLYERSPYRYSGSGKRMHDTIWELTWEVSYNAPYRPPIMYSTRKIAGQSQKTFLDKTDMEKYLQGRIAAYANLFTEISPPIPKEDQNYFCIHGVLLPGYTVENPDALKPDETKVDELLAFLEDGEISDEAPAPPPEPEPETPSPQAVWEKHRKQRTGASQRKRAPTR